jgi:hypothetical protein
MIEIDDLGGLWQRSLIKRPDGTRDAATWVAWQQGPVLFADLRIPAGRPDFWGVKCRDDLTAEHVNWLATQEGFAGRLTREGSHFVWQRDLDFQPPSQIPDAGSLRIEGDTLIEDGRDVPYVEHWHHRTAPRDQHGAARLNGLDCNCAAYIIRAGCWFMYARGRTGGALPVGRTLAECVRASGSLSAAHELIDCEISFGKLGADGWRILHSSLPYREGADLAPAVDPTAGARIAGMLQTLDITPDGQGATRTWTVLDIEGEPFAGWRPVTTSSA